MTRKVVTDKDYGTFYGLTLQAIGPVFWGGRTIPHGVSVPPKGAVELYYVDHLGFLIDTNEQIEAENTTDDFIQANAYVALVLQSQDISTHNTGASLSAGGEHVPYAIIQNRGCGIASGRPLNVGCPGVGRVLQVAVTDTSGITPAPVGAGIISWTGECWIGGIPLPPLASATLGNYVAILNLVLSCDATTFDEPSSGVIVAAAGIDRLGAGGVARGGGSGSSHHGGGGGGGAYGYVPATGGNSYPYLVDGVIELDGDGLSFVRATPGNDGTTGGEGGTAEVFGVLGPPAAVPGWPVSGEFDGGDGSAGTASKPGVGGGAGGTGAAGEDALKQLIGPGGFGSDGQEAQPVFPAGGDGAFSGDGQDPGGGSSGADATLVARHGGSARLVVFQGAASFMFHAPNGLTGFIGDPSQVEVTLSAKSCDPFTLVFAVHDPDPCSIMPFFTLTITNG